MLIKNSAWKESTGKADWVIVSDMDELVYHPDLTNYFIRCKEMGITIPKVTGFNMFSTEYPKVGIPITNQIKRGSYSKNFSKQIIFDPNKIVDINYSPGAHAIEPDGDVKVDQNNTLKLLHYKYIGPFERIEKRWLTFGKELSAINIEKKWAIERQETSGLKEIYEYVKTSTEWVIQDDLSVFTKLWLALKKRTENPSG